MNDPLKRGPSSRELLEAWRNEPVKASARGVSDPERQIRQMAAVLRGVEARRRQSSRFVRLAAGLAIAAAVAGVFVGTWSLSGGELSADRAAETAGGVRLALAPTTLRLRSASGEPLPERVALAAGMGLETAGDPAELVFSSGARTEVSREAALSIVEAGTAGRESILLTEGRVDVDVPERVAPVVFSVRTPDAVVIVHGTRFSVAVDPQSLGGRTRVAVTRGVVAVHSAGKEVRLTAGEHWPEVDAAPAPPETPAAAGEPASVGAPAASNEAAPDTARREPAMKRASRLRNDLRHEQRRRARATADESGLLDENRAFASAMAKKKAGNWADASSDIEAFIARYPDSVLLQEAQVERFRLLHRLGRFREAAQRARQYLGDYRDGYARDEAREIALERP